MTLNLEEKTQNVIFSKNDELAEVTRSYRKLVKRKLGV